MALTVRFVDNTGAVTFDLNDETGYFILDGTKFPLPKVLYTEVENSLEDGNRLAYWRLGGRSITLRMNIQGTDADDLKEKRDALLKRLLTPGILEVCNWGESESVYYTTRPSLPELPDYAKKFIKDENAETRIEIEIPVDTKVYKGKETIVLFENLAPNPSFEDGNIDGWNTVDNMDSEVSKSLTYAFEGTYSVLMTHDQYESSLCYLETVDYIPIDITKHHQLDIFAMDFINNAGSILTLSARCYNEANTYLGEVKSIDGCDLTGINSFLQIGCLLEEAKGVIEPNDWPAGTTKVKLRTSNTAANSTCWVDEIVFGVTDYLATRRMEAAISITVPPDDIKGIRPAPAQIFMDKGLHQPSVIIIGEKADYYAEFEGIKNVDDGTSTVNCGTSINQQYEVYNIPDNLVQNPSLELPGSFSESNSDAFTNWTITRSSIPGTAYIGATNNAELVYSGTWALAFYSGSTGSVSGNAVTDYMAINNSKDYMWSIRALCEDPFYANHVTLKVEFYNVSSTLLGSKTLLSVAPPDHHEQYSGYLYADDMPENCTKVKLRAYGSMSLTPGSYLTIDLIEFTQCEGGVIGETNFSLESHQGKYLDLALVSVSAALGANTNIDIQARIISDSLGAITDVFSMATVDIGDPATKWVCTCLQSAGWNKSITPVTAINSQADLSKLSEQLRALLPSDFDTSKDFWMDFWARIPIDQALVIITNLATEEHLIAGEEGVFVSLDGTVDSASIIDQSKVTPPFAPFVVDPDGINMVFIALYNNDGSYEPRPIMDIKLEYYPCYLL